MEKGTPHVSLLRIRELALAGKVRSTWSALNSAAALGLDFDNMLETLRTLKASDFYKSMTAYNNHRLWQDVYRPESGVGGLYVKLTVTDEVLILSFKER
jgi:motility quorum-sensing regulator / GCU-specific mRNA interferase toxin